MRFGFLWLVLLLAGVASVGARRLTFTIEDTNTPSEAASVAVQTTRLPIRSGGGTRGC
jgi:hypothetical protein